MIWPRYSASAPSAESSFRAALLSLSHVVQWPSRQFPKSNYSVPQLFIEIVQLDFTFHFLIEFAQKIPACLFIQRSQEHPLVPIKGILFPRFIAQQHHPHVRGFTRQRQLKILAKRPQGWGGRVRPAITTQVLQQLTRGARIKIPGHCSLVGRSPQLHFFSSFTERFFHTFSLSWLRLISLQCILESIFYGKTSSIPWGAELQGWRYYWVCCLVVSKGHIKGPYRVQFLSLLSQLYLL